MLEQSKSSAEAFIESVQESLRDQRLEVEESVAAADIGQLQQNVADLEQQVRCVCRVCVSGRVCLSHAHRLHGAFLLCTHTRCF